MTTYQTRPSSRARRSAKRRAADNGTLRGAVDAALLGPGSALQHDVPQRARDDRDEQFVAQLFLVPPRQINGRPLTCGKRPHFAVAVAEEPELAG